MLAIVLFMGEIEPRGTALDSDRPVRVSTVGICQIGAGAGVGQLLPWAPQVGWLHRVVLPGLIVLPGLLLILKQPDLGSGRLFSGLCGDAADGRRPFQSLGDYSVALGHVVSVCLGDGLGLTPRLPARTVMAFVDPDYDPGGKGYHALQSRIAIGSGELSGKGLYGGTQSQLKFLPEGHTDFVFAVYAEEWGFVGVLVLLALFIALIWVSLEIAARAKDTLGRCSRRVLSPCCAFAWWSISA